MPNQITGLDTCWICKSVAVSRDIQNMNSGRLDAMLISQLVLHLQIAWKPCFVLIKYVCLEFATFTQVKGV